MNNNYKTIIEQELNIRLATLQSKEATSIKKKAKQVQYCNGFVISANINKNNISIQKEEFFNILANASAKELVSKRNPKGTVFNVKEVEKLNSQNKPYTVKECDQIEEIRRTVFSPKSRSTFKKGTTTKQVSKYFVDNKLNSQNKIKDHFGTGRIKQSTFAKWKEALANEQGFTQEEAIQHILEVYSDMISHCKEKKSA
tara:strand:+ start:479 stop:1075 length:597 start_codon:yes stop_codon:yes gene_type:complete